jgi:hypothetical protein
MVAFSSVGKTPFTVRANALSQNRGKQVASDQWETLILPLRCLTEQHFLMELPAAVVWGFRASGPGFIEREFAVIVSEFDRSTASLTRSACRAARVVGSCFRAGTVLPFRFGTIFDTDESLRHAVRANRRAFGLSVARLKGKAEVHVKVLVRDGQLRQLQDVTIPDTVGGDYLIKLREKAMCDRERQTKAKALSVQVHRLFNPLEEEITCKRVDTDGMLIDIAHLIDSKHIEKYQNRPSSAANSSELRSFGERAWPPYHFCRAICGPWRRFFALGFSSPSAAD